MHGHLKFSDANRGGEERGWKRREALRTRYELAHSHWVCKYWQMVRALVLTPSKNANEPRDAINIPRGTGQQGNSE